MGNNKFSVYKGLALITQIGLQMIIPIVVSVMLAGYLTRKFNLSDFITILLVILGVIIGFLNVYKMVMKDINKKNK